MTSGRRDGDAPGSSAGKRARYAARRIPEVLDRLLDFFGGGGLYASLVVENPRDGSLGKTAQCGDIVDGDVFIGVNLLHNVTGFYFNHCKPLVKHKFYIL